MSCPLWIGSPFSFISIVTTPKFEPSMCSTFVTLPTSTPAIRTGESRRMLLADWNTALNSNASCQGSDLLNARKVVTITRIDRDQPGAHGLIRPWNRRTTTTLPARGVASPLPSLARR